MPIALPFLRSLIVSPREEDREIGLRIVGDILCEGDGATALEATLADSILSSLERADDPIRLALGKRLAASPRAEPWLIDALAQRDDAAGRWLLAHARRVSGETLSRALAEPRRARCLAERDDLSPESIDDLVASQDLPTLVALARNARLTLARPQLARLVAAARECEPPQLARALLARAPMSAECAGLFLEATPHERAEILLALQRTELAQPARLQLRDPDTDRLARLERSALEGRSEVFVADLAKGLGCAETIARRIVADGAGEPLAVALTALQAPNDLVVRVLTAFDLADGADYRRLGAMARLRGVLSPTSATLTLAALMGVKPARARAQTPAPARRAAGEPPREVARTLPHGAEAREAG